MPKERTQFVCQECGAETPKWLGQCPGCAVWGTLVEEIVEKVEAGKRSRPRLSEVVRPRSIAEIPVDEASDRRTAGVAEFDRIIGGGMVPGSVVLFGGPPGVGKSTLVFQVAAGCAVSSLDPAVKVLFVSAEESPVQIANRAYRLGLGDSQVEVMGETELEVILDEISRYSRGGGYDLVVVDSIQTVRLASLMSAAGTVAQVRECAARLTEWAKGTGATVILVGHVTKEGQLAGPKVLEHLVDVVCYLDEEAAFDLRVLRTHKNRYGNSGEIGLFEMTERGLIALPEDELPWMGVGALERPAIFGVLSSASRCWLSEVQALVTPTSFQFPRRISIGFESNRLAMLLAVVEKHLKMPMGTRDIHVNVVGGLRQMDTSLDLAVVLAVLGSYLDQVPSEPVAAIGEVGLDGLIRRTTRQAKRIGEAERYGIPSIIAGGGDAEQAGGVHPVQRLSGALMKIFDMDAPAQT